MRTQCWTGEDEGRSQAKSLSLECYVEAWMGVTESLSSGIACLLGIPGVVLASVCSVCQTSSLPSLISVDIREWNRRAIKYGAFFYD